ncbi:monooxygenase [Mucor circinelloides]
MINPFNQHHGIIMYNSTNHSRCCMCIPTRIGVPLILTAWIAVSLFFASFSFMNKSPFFSYFSAPATIVFGVINVLFVLVLLYGYTLHVLYRSVNRYRQYAKLFACFVSAILIDMFVNCILFAVKKDEFIAWCTNRSADAFQKTTAIALDTQVIHTLEFNCYKLHDTEAKLSFMFLVFFVFVFVR